MHKRLKLLLGLALFGALIVAGCQPTTGYYLGAKAEPATVIALQDALETEQHWQDLYVSVDFRVQQQDIRLVVAGTFAFADYPQLNMALVQDFKLKLFLLNKDQLVIDYLDLSRTLGNSLHEEMVFSKTLAMSLEVTALSFGYEGYFVDETGARESVWALPKRNF